MKRSTLVILVGWFGLWAPTAALAQLANPIPTPIPDSGIRINLEEVASGLVAPDLLTHAGDGSGRRFVVDQLGTVKIINSGGALLPTPFLDLSARVETLPGRNENPPTPGDGLDPGYDERGLLGLAFHPDFATNGKLYTYHSEATSGPADFTTTNASPFNNQSVITEWHVDPSDPNRVDLSSGARS